MQLVVQKVAYAKLVSNDETFCDMGRGLIAYVCFERGDTLKIVQQLAEKLLNFRFFSEEEFEGVFEHRNFKQPWKRSVTELGFSVLLVSQFTLAALTSKGSKPNFHCSLPAAESRVLYEGMLSRLGELYTPEKIFRGNFGNHMDITMQSCGPCTICFRKNGDSAA